MAFDKVVQLTVIHDWPHLVLRWLEDGQQGNDALDRPAPFFQPTLRNPTLDFRVVTLAHMRRLSTFVLTNPSLSRPAMPSTTRELMIVRSLPVSTRHEKQRPLSLAGTTGIRLFAVVLATKPMPHKQALPTVPQQLPNLPNQIYRPKFLCDAGKLHYNQGLCIMFDSINSN
ncbi:hypothetical protein GQR58_011003 [Nymphon striatum]|nr:hypothetical protein GQR58_011003 [Nymphon striatum]